MVISIFIGILSLATVFCRDSIGPNLAGLSLTSAITIMQVDHSDIKVLDLGKLYGKCILAYFQQ